MYFQIFYFVNESIIVVIMIETGLRSYFGSEFSLSIIDPNRREANVQVSSHQIRLYEHADLGVF